MARGRPNKPRGSFNLNAAQYARMLNEINAIRAQMGLPAVSMPEVLDSFKANKAKAAKDPGSVPARPPRPERFAPINTNEQPPFPPGLMDPTKPLSEQDLFHGSRNLGDAIRPEGEPRSRQFLFDGYPVPPGTDLAPKLDPRRADFEGHLGPALLYTTTDKMKADRFGPIYRATLDADTSDFIGMHRLSHHNYPGYFGQVQQNPQLLRNLLSIYEDTTGSKAPPNLTLRQFNQGIAGQAATKSLLDSNVDVDAANTILRQTNDNRPTTPTLTQLAVNDGGFLMDYDDARDMLIGNNVMRPGEHGDLPQLRAAHFAGKDAVQKAIVDSGAAGLTERYPNNPYTGTPQQHFAVYDKNAIRSLVKLAVMLGLTTGGATASGLASED